MVLIARVFGVNLMAERETDEHINRKSYTIGYIVLHTVREVRRPIEG